MTITQVQFISLSRFPELKGQDQDSIRTELGSRLKVSPHKIELDMNDQENPMSIITYG